MTDIKLDAKLAVGAGDALTDYAKPLYDRLGKRVVGVVELRSVGHIGFGWWTP